MSTSVTYLIRIDMYTDISKETLLCTEEWS